MPPSVESGVYEGQFVQTDYGFGFPIPAKWIYLRLSADQEVDEVARFCDPTRQMIVRVSVQLRNSVEKLSSKAWVDISEQELKNHEFKIQKNEPVREYKTLDSGNWVVAPFNMEDPKGWAWSDEEWALAKDDLLIGVHATLPQEIGETEKGKKLFKALEASVSQIHWYTPIGPRGISGERFELQHFTEGFRQALESGSLSKVGVYFDEMYPERAKWNNWYQQLVLGDPKSFELKAELTGLVINGDNASASFTIARKDKSGSKPQKYEKDFKLSKKEGHWEITFPLDKS